MSRTFSALLLLAHFGPLAGFADEKGTGEIRNEKWKLFAECRMVVLSQKAALPVIELFGQSDKSADAWERLAHLVESGEAVLEADLIARGAAETQLASESLEEIRYPSEYYPAQLPRRVAVQHAPAALKVWPVIGATPTAFEAGKAGETLSFSAKVLDGGAVLAVSMEAVHRRLQSWTKFDYAELPGGMRLTLSQPQFSHLKNNLTFRMRNGEKLLVGVHRLDSLEKRFELFVLQARAARAGAESK